MKNAFVILGFIGVLMGMLPSASARPVDCLLEIEGKTYIKGICEFTSRGGGNFQIAGKEYFAQLNIHEKGKGSVNWNASPGSTHAQAYIDDVQRKGACWESKKVKICARSLSKDDLAKIKASQPNGEIIELMVAGYPEIYTRGHRFEPGTELVLGSGGKDSYGGLPKLFKRSMDNILIDKHPGLCIDAKTTDKSNVYKLVLEDCARISNKWQYSEGVIRSTSNDLCWTLHQDYEKSKVWPINVIASPCNSEINNDIKFEFYDGTS